MNFAHKLTTTLLTAFLLVGCNSLPQVSISFEDKESEEDTTQLESTTPESSPQAVSQPNPVVTKEDTKPADNSTTVAKKQADNIIANQENATDQNSDIQEDQIAKASVNQKYSNLVQVLNCPSDRSNYGKFHDYGYWGGGSWCGQESKAGYWVWVDPNWYIWQTVATNEQQPQTTLKPTPTENSTDQNSETKSSGGNLIGLEDTPSPNKEMIIDLKNLGVFDNLGWDFNLLEPITRGECMALIYYANNAVRSEENHLRLAPSFDPGFTDIDSSHPAYKYVQALANAGYSIGYPDNTFKPDQPITREELIGIKVPLDIGTQEYRDRNDWDFNDYEQIDRKFKSDINYDDDRIQGEKGSNIQRAFGSIKSFKPKQAVWGYEAAATLWQFGSSSPYVSGDPETAIDQPE